MAKRKQQQLVRITWPSLDKEMPEAKKIRLDPPPSPYERDQNQMLSTVLSMLMTVISPIVLVMTMLLRSDQGSSAIKLLMIAGSVLTTALTLTMASLSLRSQRKQVQKQKEETEKKFAFYRSRLSVWNEELEEAYQNQKLVLQTWHPSLRDLFSQLTRIIANKSDEALPTNLWWIGKENHHLLHVTLGKGSVPLMVQAEMEQRDFQDADTELLQKALALEEQYTFGHQFPYVVNLQEATFLAGCGSRQDNRLAWLRAVLTRLTLTHRYDSLRVFILSSGSFEKTEVPDEEAEDGDPIPWYYHLPHVMGEMGVYHKTQLENFLEDNDDLFRLSAKERGYHALIVIDDWAHFEEEPVAKRLLQMEPDHGVVTLVQVSSLTDVPQGNAVIAVELNMNATQATVYRNGLRMAQLDGLKEELDLTFHVRDPEKGLQQMAVYMSNVYFPNAPQSNLKQTVIPDSILFDDLFTDLADGLDEGMTKKPILRSREIKRIWDVRDIAFSDANHIYAIAGRGWEGKNHRIDLFKRNHGFVGGTTGSGKSVFLQAYLLSMAVSYSPENIGFILIDGKGGGMAEPLKHLPHVRGTADSGELFIVQRALTAIDAEFRKRDEAFKETGQFEWKEYMKGYYREKEENEKFHNVKVRPNLPLLLIVFDELGQLIKFSAKKYSEIVDNLLNTLERLAGQGRSYGIRLLFSGHSPNEAQRVAHNLDYMIALKVEDRDSSKAMIGDDRAIRIRSKGRGFIRMGEEVVEFQGAYAKPERVASITKELQFLAREYPVEPIVLEPLPQVIRLAELSRFEQEKPDAEEDFAIPLGLLDLPEQQSQLPWSYNLAEEGNIAFTGPMKSGKTMALHSIIMLATRRFTPQDVNVWLVDWDGYSLKKWSGFPHVVEYMDDRNDGLVKFKRLMNYLYNKMEERKEWSAGFDGRGWNEFRERAHMDQGCDLSYHVLAIDGYVRVTEYLEQRSMDDNQRFMSLLSDGARYGIYIVSTINNSSIASRSRGKRGFNTIIPLASSELCYEFYGREGLRMTEEVPGRAVVRLDWKVGRTLKKICCEIQMVMPISSTYEWDDQRLEDAVARSIEEMKHAAEDVAANQTVRREWNELEQSEAEDNRDPGQQDPKQHQAPAATSSAVHPLMAAAQTFLQRQGEAVDSIKPKEAIFKHLKAWVKGRENIRYPVFLYRSLQETTREAQMEALCEILAAVVEADQTVDGIIPLIDRGGSAEIAQLLERFLEPEVWSKVEWGTLEEQLAQLQDSEVFSDKQLIFLNFGTNLWQNHPKAAAILEKFHSERKQSFNEFASLHEWCAIASMMPNGAHKAMWQAYEGDLLLMSMNVITEYLYFLEEHNLQETAVAIASELVGMQKAQEDFMPVSLIVRQQKLQEAGFAVASHEWVNL